MSYPAPLTMDNTFARDTMADRIPGVLRDVQAAHPDYPLATQDALGRLHDALVNDQPITIAELLPAPDYNGWHAAYQAQRTKIKPLTWQHTEWFFAETLLYRLLIQAVRWHETGRDPFADKKHAELDSSHLWALLDTALSIEGDFEDRVSGLIDFALWGNRADLSHPAGTLAGQTAADDDLLVDERDRVVAYFANNRDSATIHIVADNAGNELAMDFVLIDTLLAHAYTVMLHLKAHPTYVSDATIPDVWHMLDTMTAQGHHAAALADRLRRAWAEKRFRLAAHPFWVSSRFLRDLPTNLRRLFEGAALVILKGDVNYRRAVGDAVWPEDVSFSAVMDHFPAPVLALRSIKCDVLVGVSPAITGPLDAQDPAWRLTGQYGVIQCANV
jgi:uncharacterized protein with ATP-grasp and redox domains